MGCPVAVVVPLAVIAPYVAAGLRASWSNSPGQDGQGKHHFTHSQPPSFPVSSSPPEWIAAVDAAQRIARGALLCGRVGIATAQAATAPGPSADHLTSIS